MSGSIKPMPASEAERAPLQRSVESLDPGLFSFIVAQSSDWDRRALLALHAATAELCGSFAYLEIGSYLGGSLQALIRDPRCESVLSIDARTEEAPDVRRGVWGYAGNTTERMLELLRSIPGANVEKLITFEASTDQLDPTSLPVKPDYCFVDGEHTPSAVRRDAEFCARAMGGEGVIAFHDYFVVGSAISSFIRRHRREISYAVAFNLPSHPPSGGGVFALELGDRGVLRHPAIAEAVASTWHNAAWKLVNLPRRTALPLLVATAAIPAVDSFVALGRHGFAQFVRQAG